jgi:hypothetical protein
VVAADGATWTHVAGSYQGSSRTLRLYVNGRLAASRAMAGGSPVAGVGPVVARMGAGFNGLLDEVRVWGVAWSQSTVSVNRRNPLMGSEQGLVAYYRFDDGTS